MNIVKENNYYIIDDLFYLKDIPKCYYCNHQMEISSSHSVDEKSWIVWLCKSNIHQEVRLSYSILHIKELIDDLYKEISIQDRYLRVIQYKFKDIALYSYTKDNEPDFLHFDGHKPIIFKNKWARDKTLNQIYSKIKTYVIFS